MGDIHARIYVCMSILNYGRGSKHLWGSFSDTSQIPQMYYSTQQCTMVGMVTLKRGERYLYQKHSKCFVGFMLHKRTSAVVVPLPCGWSWLNVFLTNQGNFFVQTVVKPTIKSYAIQINALTEEVGSKYNTSVLFFEKFSAY